MTEFSLASYANKPLAECTELELFNALLSLTKDAAAEKGYNQGKKRLYYISAEFLIGKLLSNNLINLGLYDQVRAELAEAGRDLAKLEEFENEPSLGNGGLGRLAARASTRTSSTSRRTIGSGGARRAGCVARPSTTP